MSQRSSMIGFTLIEIIIVIAIVAILVVIAVPTYQKQVRDTRRVDATAALMLARQAMERHYSKNYSYEIAAGDDLPFVEKSPIDGDDAYYNLALSNNTATTYTITATPIGSHDDPDCGDLSIDQTGKKEAEGEVDSCWR